MQRIIEVICQNAELALFFDMYDALEQNGINTNQGMAYSAESGEDTVDQCSVGVQTELHPMPYIKDKKYTWNMWDMRRMAIKLADLQKCATKSTQTINQSSFGTQTHSERDLSKWKQLGKQAVIIIVFVLFDFNAFEHNYRNYYRETSLSKYIFQFWLHFFNKEKKNKHPEKIIFDDPITKRNLYLIYEEKHTVETAT